MKKIVWILALVAVLMVSLADRTTGNPMAKSGTGYTVKAIFAGLENMELAVGLAGNLISDWPSFQPVVTIAKDGEL